VFIELRNKLDSSISAKSLSRATVISRISNQQKAKLDPLHLQLQLSLCLLTMFIVLPLLQFMFSLKLLLFELQLKSMELQLELIPAVTVA